MSRIALHGCTPEPLASYLKALAVLRLVSEQKDPGAKGYWRGGVFVLESALDQQGLDRFFTGEYRPTPLVAPWNGGSGFYEGDSLQGRDAIRNGSADPRLTEYARTIDTILQLPDLPPTGLPLGELATRLEHEADAKKGKARTDLLALSTVMRRSIGVATASLASEDCGSLTCEQVAEAAARKNIPAAQKAALKDLVKAATKVRTAVKKLFRAGGKDAIVRRCRAVLQGTALDWLDAAIVVDLDGDLGYPPLLGTGGSEGRLDYTNAFMERVARLLLHHDESASPLLAHALFGLATDGFVVAPVGQHDPGRAGGYNQGAGIEAKEFPTNPWDFVLALEGSIVWASGAAGRQRRRVGGLVASPFSVRARGVGYESAAGMDEALSRAEVWAPIWTRPIGYSELRELFREGRADVGRRRAADTIEFAEAVTSLGVDRGIDAFVRFSLQKRRGDSYVALPAGTFPVRTRTESDVVRELERPLAALDRFIRAFGDSVPASITSARHRIDDALFALLLNGGKARARAVLVAIGRMERLLARRDPSKEPSLRAPLGGLSVRWLDLADEGGLELRIAVAIASIAGCGNIGSIRRNLSRVGGDDEFAWNGGSLARRLVSTLDRRLRDAARSGMRKNPVWGSIRLDAHDVAAFISGEVDDSLIEDLLFGVLWIRWNDDRPEGTTMRRDLSKRWCAPVRYAPIPAGYALLKLVAWPDPLAESAGEEVSVRPPREILALLVAGRAQEACEIARRRLFSLGLEPVRISYPDLPGEGERLAAGLLVPVYARGFTDRALEQEEDEE